MTARKRITPILLFVCLLLLPFSAQAQGDTEIYEDDRIRFEYPAGWVIAADPEGITLGNDEEAMESPEEWTEDIMQMSIFRDYADLTNIQTAEGDDPAELLEMGLNLPEEALEDMETLALDASSAAYTYFSNRQDGFDMLFMLIIDNEGRSAFIVALTGIGAMEEWLDMIIALAETVERIEADSSDGFEVAEDLTEQFSEDGFAFNYPEDWHVEEDDGLIIMANAEDPLDARVDDGVLVATIVPSLSALTERTYSPNMLGDIAEMVTEGYEDVEFEELSIGGKRAVIATGYNPDADTEDIVIVLLHGNTEISLLIASAMPRELRDFDDLLIAIAASMRFESEDERVEEDDEPFRGLPLPGRNDDED